MIDIYPIYLRRVYHYWISCFRSVPVSGGTKIYHVVGIIINKIFALQGRLGQIQEVREKNVEISKLREHSKGA